MIRALTFDLFGTLLDVSGAEWVRGYVQTVKAIAAGDAYIPPSFLFHGIDWSRHQLYPDVVPVFQKLRERYYLCQLSNAGFTVGMEIAMTHMLPWSIILATEVTKCYKPDPLFYSVAISMFLPSEILHVAAHQFDLDAAKALGFKTAFVKRPGEGEPGSGNDYQVEDLFQLEKMLP